MDKYGDISGTDTVLRENKKQRAARKEKAKKNMKKRLGSI
jgi:hypothetical protein